MADVPPTTRTMPKSLLEQLPSTADRASDPPHNHNVHPVYRPDIDGLRAFAILSVLIFHAFPTIMHGGFVGVDIFFVISGFLISSILFKSLKRNDFNFTEFYAHRVQRIFPALLLVLVASYAFGWFALLTDEYKQLGKHIAAGAGFVQNFVLWQESGYFDTTSELKPLMHLWSLAVEEQFYILYPALIWCAWRVGLNVLATVVLLGTLSFGLNVVGIEKDAVKTFFSPQTRFWELMIGAVLAHVQSGQSRVNAASITHQISRWLRVNASTPAREREEVANNLLATCGFIFILLSVFTLDSGKAFPGWWALLPVLGASFLILAGPQAWVNRNILAQRHMVFIGLISYPLYLWHWPILTFARILNYGTPTPSIRLVALVLSFVLAWMTYRWIEKPIRFGRKTWLETTSLSLLIFGIGFMGYNAFQRNGLEFRYRQMAANNSQFAMPDTIVQDSECIKKYPAFATAGFCAKSNAFPPSVLLLGDSHAEHFLPGMIAATTSTRHSVSQIVKGGCLPFFDVTSIQKGEPESCLDLMSDALEFIENTKSIQTVVMATRGPMYLSGKGFGDALNEPNLDRKLVLTNRPEITDFKEIFRIGMAATLKRLTDSNKQIIFVLDIPELDFDPKSCVESPLRLRKFPRKVCAVSRQAFDDRNRDYREVVSSVLKDFPSVKIFDAAAELCDDKWCWASKDLQVFYRDSNHLSRQGSKHMVQPLIKLIDTFDQ